MQVFWLRHGTRDFITGDVPLNDEGQLQAHELAENSRFSRLDTILCSPKKRAQMTISPLAQKYQLEITTLEELDQMKNHESETEFTNRVRSLLEKIENQTFSFKSLVLCTHSDWLGVASQIIPTDSLDLKYKMFQCAEVIEFNIIDGLWTIEG